MCVHFTATPYCAYQNIMDDEAVDLLNIDITTSSGNPDDLISTDTPWESDEGDTEPTITVAFPSNTTFVSVSIEGTNIQSVEIIIVREDGTTAMASILKLLSKI